MWKVQGKPSIVTSSTQVTLCTFVTLVQIPIWRTSAPYGRVEGGTLNHSRVAKASTAVLAATTAFGIATTTTADAHGAPAPKTVSPTPGAKAPGSGSYTVVRGDTLSAIAHRLGVSVASLAQANSLSNPNRIFVGQRLTVPSSGGATTVTSTPNQASSAATSTYTVARGDTLGAIAKRFGTSVAALASANGISNPNRIWVGQQLTIPSASGSQASPAQPATPAHTVSTQAPAAQGSSTQAPSAQASGSASTPASSSYTVAQGDTLSSIARKLGTTVAQLAKANGIANPNRIYPGQKLITPSGSTSATSTAAATATKTSSGSVPKTFLGYTYSDSVNAAANNNKASLDSANVPGRAAMQNMVREVAVQMGVDPALALAHAYTESGFNAKAVSPANAVGVMQVIPSSGTWASQLVGRQLNLLDPHDNVVAGVAIIRWLQTHASSVDEGIAGYYQGLGGVRKYGMKSDTIAYVNKVKAAMARF